MSDYFYKIDDFRMFYSDLSEDETVALAIPSDELLALNDVSAIYVYCSKDSSTYYIGQTNAFLRRHSEHVNEKFKSKLDYFEGSNSKYEKYFGGGKVVIFFGEKISSNLNYIEQRLIKIFKELRLVYNFKVLNVPDGNKSDLIQVKREAVDKILLNMLRQMGKLDVTRFSNNQMSQSAMNSILYRHSPFFELEDNQKKVMKSIIKYNDLRKSKFLKNEKEEIKTFIVRGGAGTGKTVLMNNIIAQLLGINITRIEENHSHPIRVGICLQPNMIGPIKKIFKVYKKSLNTYGIYIGNWMSIIREGKNRPFDYIIVDESQRLVKYRTNLFPSVRRTFLEENEADDSLNLLLRYTDKIVLFYDETQTIRPSDIDPIGKKGNYNSKYKFSMDYPILDETLSVQYRIKINSNYKGYNRKYASNYIEYIKYLLNISEKVPSDLDFLKTSYFGIVNSLEELNEYTDRKRDIFPFKTSRIISGDSKPRNHVWKELNNKVWNTSQIEWSTNKKFENEVGAIHSIQGFDMDYIGLIVGNDIQYDFDNEKLISNKNNYYDRQGKSKLNNDELLSYLKNIYYVLFTRGIYGIRVYFEDSELRKYWECKTEELKRLLNNKSN
jgi:hypothetical protein